MTTVNPMEKDNILTALAKDPNLNWLPKIKPPKTKTLASMELILSNSKLNLCAGVDEAGRGACAGPLVAAACILPSGAKYQKMFSKVRDSKKLTPKVRKEMYELITKNAISYSIVIVSVNEIDKNGVHKANISALRRAVARLDIKPDYVLIDGFSVPGIAQPSLGIPKGDDNVLSIAAASIIAKVTRDEIMEKLHQKFPEYDFNLHKGYCTKNHIAKLNKYGCIQEHRMSFSNVAEINRKLMEITNV